jgi:hypothetical protein
MTMPPGGDGGAQPLSERHGGGEGGEGGGILELDDGGSLGGGERLTFGGAGGHDFLLVHLVLI